MSSVITEPYNRPNPCEYDKLLSSKYGYQFYGTLKDVPIVFGAIGTTYDMDKLRECGLLIELNHRRVNVNLEPIN